MKINIEECYKKYAPMVFRRCLYLLKNEDEALDASQDVFVNVLRHDQRLHGQFISSLLYTIATNVSLNKLRRQKLQNNKTGGNYEHGADDPEYDRVEHNMMMDAILQNESESTRSICFMYHADGMTLKEIGDVTGMSISGVRKRLLAFSTRAKLKLKGEML